MLMDSNLQSQVPSPRSISGEALIAIVGAVGSALLLLKKLLGAKAAGKPDPVSRSDFYAEMSTTQGRINATHLALLDKLEANHRELLAGLDRLSARLMAVEAGLARLDERTKRQR
jgi:hypothetical protein